MAAVACDMPADHHEHCVLARAGSGTTSSSSVQTATPSSANGSVLQMAERTADGQPQACARSPADGHPRKRCRSGREEQTSGCIPASDAAAEPQGKRRQPQVAALAIQLRAAMHKWSHNLFNLQPKCKIDESLPEFAIAIFTAYVRVMHEQMNNGVQPARVSPDALAAACFWIAIKADGSRACLPSRALLERACSVRAAVLSATELEVLVALDWEIFGVLRRAGFRCTVRPAEEGPELC